MFPNSKPAKVNVKFEFIWVKWFRNGFNYGSYSFGCFHTGQFLFLRKWNVQRFDQKEIILSNARFRRTQCARWSDFERFHFTQLIGKGNNNLLSNRFVRILIGFLQFKSWILSCVGFAFLLDFKKAIYFWEKLLT